MRRLRLPRLWILGLLAVLLPARAQEGGLVARVFAASAIGSGERCWCAAQDERGVLYFGSNGLLTFDGETWTSHAVPSASAIRCVAIATNGRVWVGGINEIGYFDRQRTGELGPYHSLVPVLPPGAPPLQDVWHAFVRSDGTVVFITNDAVWVWDGRQFRFHPLPGGRRLIASRIEDKIYVGHGFIGLWEFSGDTLRPIASSAELQGRSVFWLKPEGSGWLLGTHQGLARFDGHALTPIDAGLGDYLEKSAVSSVCELPDGRVCFTTVSGGLVVVDPAGRRHWVFTARDGLPSHSLLSTFIARDRALWVTSGAGLIRIRLDQSAWVFGQSQGLAGQVCHGLVEVDGAILVATDDGVFSIAATTAGPVRAQPAAGLSGFFNDMVSTPAGLFGAGYRGVIRWVDGEASTIYPSTTEVMILHPSTRESGGFLAAANFDLVRLSPAADGRFLAHPIARMPGVPISAAEDTAGQTWVGLNSHGVVSLREDRPSTPESLVRPNGTSVSGSVRLVNMGRFIAVGSASGLELLEPQTRHLSPVPVAPTTAVLTFSNPDATGGRWVAFASPFDGAARLPLLGRLLVDANGRTAWTPFAVPGLDQIGAVSSLLVDHRGILWIGGHDAVLRVDPARLAPIAPPHAPLLLSGGTEPFPADHAPITVRFASLEYTRPQAVRFQSRLAGSNWSPPTDNTHLTLAGLRDGDYEFSVRLINDAGLVGPAATWKFRVLPPWYRTTTAYTAWSLLALLGFFGAVQWRSAYLRRHNAQLEALVQKKTAQLEKANAAKSEFLANMSHEIRNPISGIVGLSLAMDETSLDVRQRQLNNSIRSCAALLATLVDDVLDFSRIEAGRVDLRPAPFNLRASLEQCLAMVDEEVRRQGGELRLEWSDALPAEVVGDSARVQQIVLNYLTNAQKFAPGKPIVVGAQPAQGQSVRLFVRDQGPGIASAELATLFTKFTRLEPARSGNIRGSGLGLAVCRLLASKMGGSVGADSTPGQGSCFWADLPLPAASRGASASAEPAAPAPLAAPLHALIVEDIDYNATAMQAVLRKLGVTSDVASDGPTALEKLQATFYDVAFMDWNLPGMIGTEVVSRYRAIEPPQRRTIIIATTAYSADFNREACLEAGMDAFIAKPFTPEKISAALRDLRGSLRAAVSVVVPHDPAPPPPAAAAEIDLQMLRLLADDAPNGLAGQIDRYLASFDTDRAALAAAVAAGHAREIHRFAHRLVAHASVVKYEPLVRLARELQAHAATEDVDHRRRLFAEFEREFAQLRSKLDSFRAATAPA